MPVNAKDLIEKLLHPNPTMRLGYKLAGLDYEALKSHPFFNGNAFHSLDCAEYDELKK